METLKRFTWEETIARRRGRSGTFFECEAAPHSSAVSPSLPLSLSHALRLTPSIIILRTLLSHLLILHYEGGI